VAEALHDWRPGEFSRRSETTSRRDLVRESVPDYDPALVAALAAAGAPPRDRYRKQYDDEAIWSVLKAGRIAVLKSMTADETKRPTAAQLPENYKKPARTFKKTKRRKPEGDEYG
jgi:hypothetical protein